MAQLVECVPNFSEGRNKEVDKLIICYLFYSRMILINKTRLYTGMQSFNVHFAGIPSETEVLCSQSQTSYISDRGMLHEVKLPLLTTYFV